MTTKSTSKNEKQGPNDVDAYLASQPEAFRRSLRTLRGLRDEVAMTAFGDRELPLGVAKRPSREGRLAANYGPRRLCAKETLNG